MHPIQPAHKTKHIPLLSYPFNHSTFNLAQEDNGRSNGTTLWLAGQVLSAFLLDNPALQSRRACAIDTSPAERRTDNRHEESSRLQTQSSRTTTTTARQCKISCYRDPHQHIASTSIFKQDTTSINNPRLSPHVRSSHRPRAIELGSGIGLSALALASLGYDVLATDLPTVISSVLSHNINNNVNVNLPSGSGSIQVRALDWTVTPEKWTWSDEECITRPERQQRLPSPRDAEKSEPKDIGEGSLNTSQIGNKDRPTLTSGSSAPSRSSERELKTIKPSLLEGLSSARETEPGEHITTATNQCDGEREHLVDNRYSHPDSGIPDLLGPPFDLIITADTVYNPSLTTPLLRTIKHLCLISHPLPTPSSSSPHVKHKHSTDASLGNTAAANVTYTTATTGTATTRATPTSTRSSKKASPLVYIGLEARDPIQITSFFSQARTEWGFTAKRVPARKVWKAMSRAGFGVYGSADDKGNEREKEKEQGKKGGYDESNVGEKGEDMGEEYGEGEEGTGEGGKGRYGREDWEEVEIWQLYLAR